VSRSKVNDAAKILRAFGLPEKQCNERCALTLLALGAVKPRTSWRNAKQPLLRTVDIMQFMRDFYDKDYKPNSRETIRRQTLHQFEQARIVDRNPDDPQRPTNSGNNCYALSTAAVSVIRSFGGSAFTGAVEKFIASHGRLVDEYARLRASQTVPLRLATGEVVRLSPGRHNTLQVAVIEQFGPRFAPGASLLYLGDTAQKHVYSNQTLLQTLRVPITEHDKLPDVVLFDHEKDWLYLIEAVTSHGPVSPKRHSELEAMLVKCRLGRVYVTAFISRDDFRKRAADIAWETEVWIADDPDHMIHYNGPRFLGPYD